ncbi:MAG: Crp/Fnr family transcriptional regulator [Oceanospirillaceae bacterium]|nr:Crp/Fnr family transcriptional regulator [Oceanospirillaceae bacterium]
MNNKSVQLVAALPQSLAATKAINMTRDEVLIHKGEVTTHAYLILSGEMIVQNPHANGNVYLIAQLGVGSFISDLEILSQNLINSTTIIASTASRVLKFTVSEFVSALKTDNDFLFMVSSRLADKMYHESYRLGDDLYYKGVDKLKIYLVKSYQERLFESTDNLIIDKTRQFIASEIGVSVKTINRSIKSLLKDNLVAKISGKILLKDQHYQALLKMTAKFKTRR